MASLPTRERRQPRRARMEIPRSPDVWLVNSAEEDLTTGPATKGGRFHSLQNLGFSLDAGLSGNCFVPSYDSQIQ
jgi:hypothetical protein